jgi:serine/threonine-protein kinase RsbW
LPLLAARPFRLIAPAKLDQVRFLALAMRAVLTEAVGDRLPLDEVELALVEICNNVVIHAVPTGELELQLVADLDAVTFTILDDAEPRVPPPGPYALPGSAEAPAEGGYGLFLITTIFDEVTFAPISGRNAVRCVKKLQ